MKGGGAGGSSTQKVGSRGDARWSMHRRRRPEADLTSTTPLRSLSFAPGAPSRYVRTLPPSARLCTAAVRRGGYVQQQQTAPVCRCAHKRTTRREGVFSARIGGRTCLSPCGGSARRHLFTLSAWGDVRCLPVKRGGASGRGEGTARVGGAIGRRERATREGGASRRRERAAREGGASGRRGSGVGALSAEQGLLHTLGLNRGNAVPGHPATRPAPQTPRRDVAAWTPVCCAQPRPGAGASGASSLLSTTSVSPPFRTDPPRSPHLGHLRQNRFAYALCVSVRRSRCGRGSGGLWWRRRCFIATVRWVAGQPRRGWWL